MTPQQSLMAMLVILTFSFIGFSFVISSLIKKINKLTKPKTPLRAELKKIESFSKFIKGFGFEERLYCIRILLGNYRAYIRVEGDQAIIEGVGRMLEQGKEEIDYTG